MTQTEFLRKLERQLRGLSESEREDALRYYEEYFLDAEVDPTADVTQLVGTPEDCARWILAELLEKQEQQPPSVKSGAKSAKLVLLGVLAAPVALPVALVAVILVITAICLVAGMFLLGIGLAIMGLCLLVGAFWAGTPGQTLVIFGVGLVLIPCGALISWAALAIWKAFTGWIAKLFRGKERRK